METSGLYANALGHADIDAGHDAHSYRDSQAGCQRYLHLNCHAVADAQAFPDRYPYANANADVHADDDSHSHPNGHAHQHTDPHPYCDDHAYADAQRHPDANADFYAGPRTSAAMTFTTGEPVPEETGLNLPPEGDVKPKRLNLQLTDRQQVVIGFVLVILVAISMLYCLGFASVALRNAWESGPLPWSENNDYPAESTPLPLTPIVEPTENDVAPH